MKQTLIHHGRKTFFTCSVPEGEGPFPVVLFSHGYNGYLTDFDFAAELLRVQGIASAAIAFSGGSTRDESGFPSTSMTLVTEKEDLLSLIEWAEKQDFTDKNRIYLFGGSMGGLVSCLAAHEAKEKIRALMLLFPALCIVDDWNDRFKEISDIPEEMNFWNLSLGKNFFVTMRDIEIDRMLSEMDMKTLIFQGDSDPIVPLACSEKAEKTMKNARLIVFEGEGHGFSEEANRKIAEIALAFVKENL